MTTVWNSADNVGLTLSNSDLTATRVGGSANAGIRSTNPKDSTDTGKYYVEFDNVVMVNSDSHIGLITEQWVVGTSSGGPSGVVFGYGGTSAFGASSPSGFSPNGKHVSMAFDLGARKMWIREDGGDWNKSGTADPETGAGANAWPDPINVIVPPFYFYYLCARLRDSNDSVTVNVGGSPFVYSPPTGYVAWDVAPPDDIELTILFQDDNGISRNILTLGDAPDLELSASFADDGGFSKAVITLTGGDPLHLSASFADDGGISKGIVTLYGGPDINLSASFQDEAEFRALITLAGEAPVVQSIVIVTGR